MMNRLRVVRNTKAADADLAEIVDYYTDVAGTALAESFLDSFDYTAALLQSTSFVGLRCLLPSGKYPGLRRLPLSGRFDRWLLFYTPSRTEVRIERIVHGARNWRRLFV